MELHYTMTSSRMQATKDTAPLFDILKLTINALARLT